MECYVSHFTSYRAIKGRFNIVVWNFTRSKFNLHLAFKPKRSQLCVGELSEVLWDLIYGSLLTRSDATFALMKLSRSVTRHFRLGGGCLRRTSPRSLLFYGRRIAPGLDHGIYCVEAKISHDARLCETFYSLLPSRCISLAAGQWSTRKYMHGYILQSRTW